MPVFIPEHDNGLGQWGYYGLPMIDIPGIKASAHYCGPTVDPDNRPPGTFNGDPGPGTPAGPAAEQVAAVVASTSRLVAATFPHVEHTPFATQSCIYTATPDHDYVIGRVPGWDNVVLAGGGSGHAFKMVTMTNDDCYYKHH